MQMNEWMIFRELNFPTKLLSTKHFAKIVNGKIYVDECIKPNVELTSNRTFAAKINDLYFGHFNIQMEWMEWSCQFAHDK